MNSTATNYDPDAKKDCCCEFPVTPVGLTVPSTYAFVDGTGASTVSFDGQRQRLEMLSEMVVYMKTANTAGTAIDETTLKDMYANNAYTWIDAPALGMTGSSKQLKNKTAYAAADGSADAGVQTYFEGLMTSMATLSATTSSGVEAGASGVGGVYPNDGVKGPYLMSGDGLEYQQIIEKGLMGAVFMSQITVNYLGTLNDDDNSTVLSGKTYTEMEHHWDEAYGYFTDAIDYPTNGTNRFWGKYANGRESILGSATNLSLAFRTGRAAISAGDMTARNAQIDIIRAELEKACGGTAIHYLNGAIGNIANTTARNHQLSEAMAFIYSLKYGYNSINSVTITNAEVDAALALFPTNFNNITIAEINAIIDYVAPKIGLDAVKGSL
jgi:hypothetical protein